MHPKWECTPEIIERAREMSQKGVLESSIARQIGIAPTTLTLKKKEYPLLAEALKKGKAYGEEVVVGKLWKMIENEDHKSHATAVLFWLKTQAGWNDKPGTMVSTNGPAKVTFGPIRDEE